jgi:hypothetical protein
MSITNHGASVELQDDKAIAAGPSLLCWRISLVRKGDSIDAMRLAAANWNNWNGLRSKTSDEKLVSRI